MEFIIIAVILAANLVLYLRKKPKPKRNRRIKPTNETENGNIDDGYYHIQTVNRPHISGYLKD